MMQLLLHVQDNLRRDRTRFDLSPSNGLCLATTVQALLAVQFWCYHLFLS